MKAIEIQKELETYIDPVKREYLPGFFKTGKGQYGEGDRFLGIVVPATRLVAKKYKNAPFEVMAELLQSEWHECRLCALLMMVERFKKSGGEEREAIYRFYLSQTERINNWETLWTCQAPYIDGEYLKDKSREVFIGWRKVLCCGISVLLSYLRLPSSGITISSIFSVFRNCCCNTNMT